MASRTAGLSPRRPATRDHGIGLSLKRPHPIQPVHIGMTKTQPGFQHIETVAIVEGHSCNGANGPGGSMSAGTHDARSGMARLSRRSQCAGSRAASVIPIWTGWMGCGRLRLRPMP